MAELLRPFLGAPPALLLEQLQRYLDLLLRWNARVNLTAVRDPEQIVERHFGESLFVARQLERLAPFDPKTTASGDLKAPSSLADVGSGAGFPGIPIKLLQPHLELTLIESQNKKATFLREVLRTLQPDGAQVFCGRAEQWGRCADVVTLRAVEQFERVLPAAASLVQPAGTLCLLIGAGQLPVAYRLLGEGWKWASPVPVPGSKERTIAIASRK